MSKTNGNGNDNDFNPFAIGFQRSIARRANLDPGSTHRILTGKRGVKLDTAAKIAAAAHTTIDALYAHIENEKAKRGETANQ